MLKKWILSFGCFGLVLFAGAQEGNGPSSRLMIDAQKYNQFLYYLNRGYLEKVDTEKSTEAAIRAVLSELDPHSAYITKEEMLRVNESFEGNFEGIGIEFNVLNDTLIVVNTIAGGPAQQVGMRGGDRIIKVDTVSVIGITQDRVPKLLRGPKGTLVELTVIRKGEEHPLVFKIERDKIPMNSLDAAYMLTPNTAYLKLNRFMATTVDEFKTALSNMSGAENLILDLRGNGGGFLDQAIDLSDHLLPDGALIVYTEGRVIPRNDAIAQIPGIFEKGKLVVLVDEESASASEIVAGAVQDWDRGIIVGRPTFGKGLVQRQIPLLDSSAIRLTVARYHTPSGRVIQRPYDQGHAREYYENVMKRYTSGELMKTDSMAQELPDSLKYETLRLKRTVYGGGGIRPDVFVPLDSSLVSKYWSTLFGKRVINDYVVDYVDTNRKKLEKDYASFDVFQKSFVVDDDMIRAIVAKGEKEGVAPDEQEIERVKPTIKAQLKALIAQKLWDFNEYYRVVNAEDRMVRKALEVLDEYEKYLIVN